MADEELLGLIGQIQAARQQRAASPEPLSFGEKVKGYTQSALSGITYNFADEAESAIASLFNKVANPSVPYSDIYSQNLNTIRADQARFKEQTPYIDNAVEIGASFLNPVGIAGKAIQGSNAAIRGAYGAKTLGRLLESAPLQAGISGAGAAEGGENTLSEASKTALLGSAVSATGSVAGRALDKTGLNSTRFKLSSYGIGLGDIKKQTRKLGDDLADVADDIPIVKAINRYEGAGIINSGNDVLDNFKNVLEAQGVVNNELQGVLSQADEVLTPFPAFQTDITEDYISRLTGKARDNATAAAKEEIAALQGQIGRGTLADLQKLKVGLNYKFDQNPYSEDVIKAIRSDLRAEIENRVNSAAKNKLIPKDLDGQVKALNSEWGDLADIKSSFANGVVKKYGSNAVEDVLGGLRTSGGAGSLNVMSAASGNPIFAATGALLNAARSKEGLSALSDVARDFKVPLEAIGKTIPEVVTGRSTAQALGSGNSIREALGGKPQEKKDTKQQQSDESVLDLINQIQQLRNAKQKDTQEKKASPKTLPDDLFSKSKTVEKKDVKAVESEIDKDPYLSALYEAESGRNPSAKNPKSSASGGFQFINSTAKAVGLKDPFDLAQSKDAVEKLTEPHKKEFGDDPSTLYAAHFLGATLLRKVLNDKPLKPEEEKNVKELINVALPRFEKIYQNKVA